jgi:hypothetical protein
MNMDINLDKIISTLDSYEYVPYRDLLLMIRQSLLDLTEIVNDYNDLLNHDYVKIDRTGYMEDAFDTWKKTRGIDARSTIQSNNILLIVDYEIGEDIINSLKEDIKNHFKLIDLKVFHGFHSCYYIMLNLIPEPIIYYNIYNSDKSIFIELLNLFKFDEDGIESINKTREIIRKISIDLHWVRKKYNLGLSHDGKNVQIIIQKKL